MTGQPSIINIIFKKNILNQKKKELYNFIINNSLIKHFAFIKSHFTVPILKPVKLCNQPIRVYEPASRSRSLKAGLPT